MIARISAPAIPLLMAGCAHAEAVCAAHVAGVAAVVAIGIALSFLPRRPNPPREPLDVDDDVPL